MFLGWLRWWVNLVSGCDGGGWGDVKSVIMIGVAGYV